MTIFTPYHDYYISTHLRRDERKRFTAQHAEN